MNRCILLHKMIAFSAMLRLHGRARHPSRTFHLQAALVSMLEGTAYG